MMSCVCRVLTVSVLRQNNCSLVSASLKFLSRLPLPSLFLTSRPVAFTCVGSLFVGCRTMQCKTFEIQDLCNPCPMLGPAQKPEYFTVPSEGGAAFGDHGLPLGRSEGIIRGHLLHGASVFLLYQCCQLRSTRFLSVSSGCDGLTELLSERTALLMGQRLLRPSRTARCFVSRLQFRVVRSGARMIMFICESTSLL